jgi:predicted nucleic acid-binding Zn ribbon protein
LKKAAGLSQGDAKRPRPSRKARPERSPEPEAIGSVLGGLTRARPWDAGMSLGRLGRDWRTVVGERLSLESRPSSLEAGILVVQASSAAWAAQLRFLSAEVRTRANSCLGADVVREVKVSLDGTRGG